MVFNSNSALILLIDNNNALSIRIKLKVMIYRQNSKGENKNYSEKATYFFYKII